MKRVALFSLPALALALAVAGCGKDPMSPTAGVPSSGAGPTAAALQATINQVPDMTDVSTYENPGGADIPDASAPVGSFSTSEAISPLFFFRVITSRTRDLQVTTSSDTAFQYASVQFTEHLTGSFDVVTADTTDTGVVRRVVKKPLADVSELLARFRRPLHDVEYDRDSTDDDREGWRLVAVSDREMASPEHTAKISSVELQTASGLDVTITDPLALMRFPADVPKVLPGEAVKVTVQTSDPTDVVFLLAGWGRHRLNESSPGVFTGSFKAPFEPRTFRVGVNAFTHGTLFDDAAPYDSDFWGLLARAWSPMMASN